MNFGDEEIIKSNLNDLRLWGCIKNAQSFVLSKYLCGIVKQG